MSQVSQAKHVPEVSAMAKECVVNGRVSKMDLGEKVLYGVLGPDGKTANVSLADNGECTCGSKNPCYHWVAARVFAGVQNNYSIPPEYKIYKTGPAKRGPKAKHGKKRALLVDSQHTAFDAQKPKQLKRLKPKTKVQFNFRRLSDITEEAERSRLSGTVIRNDSPPLHFRFKPKSNFKQARNFN
jgi:hypothetical protein